MILQNMIVGVFVKSNGFCVIIDSYQYVNSNGGGMIIMVNDFKKVIIEYVNCLFKNQNFILDLGILNWVKYVM